MWLRCGGLVVKLVIIVTSAARSALGVTQRHPTNAGQIVSSNTHNCMDIVGTGAGAQLVQWDCLGAAKPSQQWVFEQSAHTEYAYRLTPPDAFLCATVQAAKDEDSWPTVVLADCHDKPNQLWHVTNGISKVTRQLRNHDSGTCLSTGRSDATGAPLILKPCSSDAYDGYWRIDGGFLTFALPSLWQGPYSLPLVAAAAAQLDDGGVLVWSAFKRNDFQQNETIGSGKTYTAIFNPSNGKFYEVVVQRTHHDMFCPGTARLGDGRLMITGGSDSNATTIYDPATNKWSMGPTTLIPRGYHSMVTLGDGSVFTMGGSWSGGNFSKPGEVWDPQTGYWTLKPNINDASFDTDDIQGTYRSDNHMWFQPAPNGKIFHAGPSKEMHWVELSGNGSFTSAGFRGFHHAMNGNAVMFDIGQILTLGGSPEYEESPACRRAYVIDINSKKARIKRQADMIYQRTFSSSVVLPTGEVVVVGGMAYAILFDERGSVLTAELWNPDTGRFSPLAEMTIPRNYHSVAILLKDGRVMASGSGLCGNCTVNRKDAEILTPPYLLNASGSLAVRPVITSAPALIPLGRQIRVTMKEPGNYTFALVRMSIVTHAINNDQRRVPLRVIGQTGRQCRLGIPHNPNIVTPGKYFLFAMDENNVPSVARVVRRPIPSVKSSVAT